QLEDRIQKSACSSSFSPFDHPFINHLQPRILVQKTSEYSTNVLNSSQEIKYPLLYPSMHPWNSIVLICILAAVGITQHKAKGSVLHPRKIDALIRQDKTCGKKGLTRYCHIRREALSAIKQVWQEVVPPRKDGTIPTEADCVKLNQQEVLDPDWHLSECCDATKFEKWLISPRHCAPNYKKKQDQKPNKNILVTEGSWKLGCGPN
ncbi:hypothetical protein MJO28_008237, partial [Puccinia striiformis f. sp. tritici]